MKPVRWGVLGAANFAKEHMAPAIHAAKGAEFAALATSSPEKAAGFQAFCPSLKIHATYEALLADPSIDAVLFRCRTICMSNGRLRRWRRANTC